MIYNKKNLAIYDIATSGNVRPATSGVFFTPNKTMATDSFILLEVSTPKIDKSELPENPENKPATFLKPTIIEKDGVKCALQNLKMIKNSPLPTLENCWIGKGSNAEHTEFICTDLNNWFKTKTKNIKADFPDARPLLKDNNTRFSTKVNAELLLKLLKHFVKFSNVSNSGVTIEFSDKMKPLKLKAENKDTQQTMRGFIMPLKEEE